MLPSIILERFAAKGQLHGGPSSGFEQAPPLSCQKLRNRGGPVLEEKHGIVVSKYNFPTIYINNSGAEAPRHSWTSPGQMEHESTCIIPHAHCPEVIRYLT